jgi:carboxypeptidase T
VRTLWPDRRGPNNNDPAPADTSGIHIDLHSYSQLVLWPWGFTNQPAPNGTALQTLGRKFAYFNNYFPEQSIGLYPTDGTSDSVSYGELGVPAYTIEMGTDFFQSCTAYTNTIKPSNLKALWYAAHVVRTPYLTPAGPDVTKIKLSDNGVPPGTPVTLTATVDDTHYSLRNGTEPTQNIAAAEAYVDLPPWVPGATPIPLAAVDGAYDGKAEKGSATLATGSLAKGKHLVFVRGKDAAGNFGPVSAIFLKIK